MTVMLFKVRNTAMLILCKLKDTYNGAPLATENKKRARQATLRGSIARRILVLPMSSVGLSMTLLFILSYSVLPSIRPFGTIPFSLNPVPYTHIVSWQAVKQLLVLITQKVPSDYIIDLLVF